MRAISNTSPLIFLHASGVIGCLADLFEEVWVPADVAREIATGQAEGYPTPDLEALPSGAIASVTPVLEALSDAGMWLSEDLRLRVQRLAGE